MTDGTNVGGTTALRGMSKREILEKSLEAAAQVAGIFGVPAVTVGVAFARAIIAQVNSMRAPGEQVIAPPDADLIAGLRAISQRVADRSAEFERDRQATEGD